jgi:hypothetical protein
MELLVKGCYLSRGYCPHGKAKMRNILSNQRGRAWGRIPHLDPSQIKNQA